MSNRFAELKDNELTHELELHIVPKLKGLLTHRDDGHCMRVADLDEDLMIAVATGLRKELPEFQIHILAKNDAALNTDTLFITSTKLVELRNPRPDGSLRTPLLVFIPPFTRASAEDSFGIATFEEITLNTTYSELREDLISKVPTNLQYIRGILVELEKTWSWANPVAQVRFLLTALRNKIDAEVLGASLYEIGLVPDFKVFKEPQIAVVEQRIQRNMESVREITNSPHSMRGRILNLGLTDRALQHRLIDLIIQHDTGSPYSWTKQIVLVERNWDLAFHNWQFTDQKYQDRIQIRVLGTDLPIAENESDMRLQDIIGQHFLAPRDRRKFQVTFEVSPHPAQVNGLSYFSVQILARDLSTNSNSVIGVTKNIKVWKSSKLVATVTLDKLNKIDFDEGWHFVRVLPWTEEGDPILLEQEATSNTNIHESDLFFVIPNEQFDEEPPQRAIPKVDSFEHARLRVQFTALNERVPPEEVYPQLISWAESKQKSQSAPDTIVVQYGRYGAFQILVPNALKALENAVLHNKDGVISWVFKIERGTFLSPEPESYFPQGLVSLTAFLDARQRYFSAIRSTTDLLTQAADFITLAPLVQEYAQTYLDIIEELSNEIKKRDEVTGQDTVIQSLRKMLAIDTFRIVLTDFVGKSREAILLSPTHPLRALWFCAWAELGQDWMKQLSFLSAPQYMNAVREALFSQITPLHFPVGVPSPYNRVFVNVETINAAWSIYAPTTEQDTIGLVSEIRKALSIPQSLTGDSQIKGEPIASKIARYVLQHPYTRTLNINVFNPGGGYLLADALLALQEIPGLYALRYNIRMFVSNPDALGVGEAVIDLLQPSHNTGTEASEAFSNSTGNHLFPKLNVALQSISDFSDAPSKYQAHISILFDIFPATEIRTSSSVNFRSSLPMNGLVQDFTIEFSDDESLGTTWKRQPIHGVTNADAPYDLFGELPRMISTSLATVATGVPSFTSSPVLTMSLTPIQRQLLSQIHDASDWVFTIDRHIGIELFDHGGKPGKANYLIDYSPSISSSFSPTLIITTRSLSEIQGMLRLAAEKLNSSIAGGQYLSLFDQLRLLSGRIALKLISSSDNQQMEAIGLGLARLYLDRRGLFSEQFAIPLDDCLGLFRQKSSSQEELGDSVTLRRTDIALVRINNISRIIELHLIEVKSHRQIGELGAYLNLKDAIRTQIEDSERSLRDHFDPEQHRPDRLLKNRELSTLLMFYLNRAKRYELLSEAVYRDNIAFLESINEGYILSFQRSALLFDFDYHGQESIDEDDGIVFVRIGATDIFELFQSTDTPHKLFGASADFQDDISIEEISSKEDIYLEERINEVSLGTEWRNEPVLESAHEEAVDIESSSVKNEIYSDDNMALHDEVMPYTELIPPAYDVLLGDTASSPQYCIVGEVSGRKIALDLNQTHTISLFGVQGSGKSYTLGSLIESASINIPNINLLPSPLATVVFHYSQAREYTPEYVSMAKPNGDEGQIERLLSRYGARPQALSDIVLLVPPSKLAEREREFPNLTILPLSFASSELSAIHWRYLMGAVGNQSLYLRQINLMIRQLGSGVTLDKLRDEIALSRQLRDQTREQASLRLQLAEQYIDDNHHLGNVIRPARLVIVDLRDESVDQREALELFAVMLQIFSNANFEGAGFSKLIVFDEAHKYMNHPDLIDGIVELVREMRHKATSILIASQEPRSVPVSLIELSTEIILHRFNAPQWLKHVQNANIALSSLTPSRLSNLKSGEAYIWSNKATDEAFTAGAVKTELRPRVTQHGGDTRTAT